MPGYIAIIADPDGGEVAASTTLAPENLEQAQSQRRRAAALQGIAEALNQTDALVELLPLFAARTAEALATDRVSIYVYSQSRDKVLIHYRHGETQRNANARHSSSSCRPRSCRKSGSSLKPNESSPIPRC